MAVQHGIKMAQMSSNYVALGMVGSGLTKSEHKAVARKIIKKVPGFKVEKIIVGTAIYLTKK